MQTSFHEKAFENQASDFSIFWLISSILPLVKYLKSAKKIWALLLNLSYFHAVYSIFGKFCLFLVSCHEKWCVQNMGYFDLHVNQFMDTMYRHFNGLVQKRCNSIALAMGLRLSCTNPSIYDEKRLLWPSNCFLLLRHVCLRIHRHGRAGVLHRAHANGYDP